MTTDRSGSGPVFWLAALAGLWVLRFPYLFSPRFILEGDEAVVGLMARHMARGAEFPVFFWGQTYGLALFETVPAALAFKVFGDQPLVLLQAVLAVFLVGLLPWATALRNLSGSVAWARVLTLLLATLPAWIVWSLKARGIYVGGFALSGLALALLTRPEPSRRSWIGAGVLIGVLYHVQPLWLVAVLPFLMLRPLDRDEVRRVVPPALGGCAVALLVPALLALGAHDYWRPEIVGGFDLERLGPVPERLVEAFAGVVRPHFPGPMANGVGRGAAVAFFVVLGGLALLYLKTRARAALVTAIAMTGSVFVAPFLSQLPARYLLPSTVLLVVGIATWIGVREVPWKGVHRVTTVGLLVLLVAGAVRIGYARTRGLAPQDYAEADLHTLLDHLRSAGVEGVYSVSGNIPWQILFYGDETIAARTYSATDRYPPYPRAVDSLQLSGGRTALVGPVDAAAAAGLLARRASATRVGRRYFVLLDPETALLLQLGFEIRGVEGGAGELGRELRERLLPGRGAPEG